ncbi:NADH-quinone oxidoreductase subunit N [Litorilinea aerophila]|uniref:NADH-quinone oxidoreductase subunit N n=1 Tax=Litorilinea aerophila TaxID=1204385 RepID=A0A540VAL8_9CHLR|nr:NADH-quinone oxidoreductase subunit N [Litorilinea aerophila]MCC9078313.1 NADH-quinone oxidoreductase subunit N [Litorilinea aerophila]GIV77143.1 MAG: NADH-quinone oxidoreductase subunit N [Litorilinea sp.]
MQPLMELSDLNWSVLLPELLLVVTAMAIMMVDMFADEEQSPLRQVLPWLALVGVILAGAACAWLWNQPAATFQNMAVTDHFALGTGLIVLVATALGILLSVHYIPLVNKQMGEYYALLLLAASGMVMMGSATDLIAIFLALEILSLALYILSGLHQQNPRSTEASMKYFLLGAFASSFFAYGAALVYGAAGSTQLSAIAEVLNSGQGSLFLLYPGIALLIAGFGFKVSLVPFHMWTPDVYQGAPTPITAFMSVGTKAAAFAAFIRFLLEAVPGQQESWGWALAILAVLTMTLGNLAALRQTSLKRMLAYSSIAHAGYILVGLAPGTPAGADAALFYLFTYAFMNIGAFAIVIALEQAEEDDALQNRAAGIADRWPLLAMAMAIFMFSLSGIPPLAGFFGKLFVFKAAVDGGWTWLAAIGMLNSAIAAYYYLRVTVAMYFERPGAETAAQGKQWAPLQLGVALAALFTILIGIYPSLWTGLFGNGLGS